MAAPRTTWRGTIRLSLVSIPIRVFSATSAEADVRFHELHRKCRTRIQHRKWCPSCKRHVTNDELVKGTKRADGRFVLVEPEEIARLKPRSSHTIEVSDLVTAADIDPVMVERSYYLAPDNREAGGPFALLRDALDGRAAIGRMAIHGREYLAAVVRRDRALLMMTLRTKGEMREADAIQELEFADVKAKPSELKLARQVLAALSSDADLNNLTDHYEESLRGLLAAKPPAQVSDKGDRGRAGQRVVNLMDALRESLAEATSQQPRRASRSRVLKHQPRSRRKAS